MRMLETILIYMSNSYTPHSREVAEQQILNTLMVSFKRGCPFGSFNEEGTTTYNAILLSIWKIFVKLILL